MYNISAAGDARPNASTGGRKETVKEKKVALERDQLMERVFKLYEKAKGFSLEYICEVLNQPRDPVKRMLEELCELNR